MTTQRIVGIALIVLGIAAFAWGGIFWTDRDTVLDAGPLKVQTQEREGFAVPPLLAGLALVGGAILLMMPVRRKA